MTIRPRIVLLAALLGALPGCRGKTYETQGDLLAVDADGATIAHEKIPELMDAMTMRFPARPPSILDGAQPGTRVHVTLVREGDALILVGIEPLGMARGTTPGMHDHRPRFGGVVSMIGVIHIEVAATPDGRVRAYVSDLWRRPLAARGTSGTVRLNLPDGQRTLGFVDVGDALEARTTAFQTDSTIANVALVRNGQPVDMNVLLDLTGNRAGVALVPETGCVALPQPEDGHVPRCTVKFSSTFIALGMTPEHDRAIVAVSHGATSVWSLPEANVVMGVDPMPPVLVAPGAHEPEPRLVAVRPDGAELVVVAGNRLGFFDAASGRFRRQIEMPAGVVTSLAWSPDGDRLLVASAGDGKARLVAATDGAVLRTFDVDGQVLVVALDASGRWAAAGTDVGGIAIADLADGAQPPRVLTPSLLPIAALGFAGDRLVTAGTDGMLRVLEPASGREVAEAPRGPSVALLALSPDGRLAATAGVDRTIRINRLSDGAAVERLDWHKATISVLAWGARSTLVSGDNDGILAVWDVRVP